MRTQQIIAEESGISDVVDPLGGSFYIEELTSEIEKKARDIIDQVESKGGAMQAIMDSFPQKLIEESSYNYQRDVESHKKSIVGVNCFKEDELKAPPFILDPKLEDQQKNKLKEFKKRRNQELVSRSLLNLKTALKNSENCMEYVILAADSGVTLGEISDTMREVFGRFD